MRHGISITVILGATAFTAALTALGCSGASAQAVGATSAEEVDAVNAASANLGDEIATVPASAPGVSAWNIYASVEDDGTSTLSVLGVDGSGQVVAEAVLLPGQGVAGIGTTDDASESQAQDLGTTIASDVGSYLGASPGPSMNSVHVLSNPFGLSDCSYWVLNSIGSIAGTVSGTVGAFATCPVTIGVGCVAGVVMTTAGVAVDAYSIDRAISSCKGPTPLALCQTACGNIGTQLPSCMAEAPISSCYSDCSGGAANAQTSLASCIGDALAAGAPTDADAGPDVCQALVGCFDGF
jgi:hypothetical protein